MVLILSGRDLARAWLLAAALGGVPSTAWALATGRDPLAATRAAGTLLPGRRDRPGVVSGTVAHLAVSGAWTLAAGLMARRFRFTATRGVFLGLAVAALDLAVLGRHFPAVRALPPAPQWADHAAFGAVLGWCLGGRPSSGHDVRADRVRRRR